MKADGWDFLLQKGFQGFVEGTLDGGKHFWGAFGLCEGSWCGRSLTAGLTVPFLRWQGAFLWARSLAPSPWIPIRESASPRSSITGTWVPWEVAAPHRGGRRAVLGFPFSPTLCSPRRERSGFFSPDHCEPESPWASSSAATTPSTPTTPTTEGEGDGLSYNQRSLQRWEKDEELGELSTISPVLYANMNFPNLKQDYPGRALEGVRGGVGRDAMRHRGPRLEEQTHLLRRGPCL